MEEIKNTLFVVGMPIGNKEDITLRAIKVLKESQGIITENQNTTKKILSLLNINFENKRLLTLGDFNNKNIEVFVNFIKKYKKVSLISEAGTPLISDPGFKLVNYIREKNMDIEVIGIPGPSAITTMLSISGLPTDKFLFLGFLPKKKGKRIREIENLSKINKEIKTTFVIYESKYRLIKTLEEIKAIYPKAKISLGKELTKMHEKVYYGYIEDVLEKIKKTSLKGEFVIHLLICE